MDAWSEDLLAGVERACTVDEAFGHVLKAAKSLEFDFCAYGLRIGWPLHKPQVLMINNYDARWAKRYREAAYVDIDPAVLQGQRSQTAIIWSNEMFRETPQLWEEARSYGICAGWSKSSLDGRSSGGMLTLARSGPTAIPAHELKAKSHKLNFLVHVAHAALAKALKTLALEPPNPPLTNREVEVLRRTADGMTAKEISDALYISFETVNFHLKKAVTKLGANNKTAATVKAAMLGLLH